MSYQHFTALDNVQFVNGNQLGTRMLFQVRSEPCLPVWCAHRGCAFVEVSVPWSWACYMRGAAQLQVVLDAQARLAFAAQRMSMRAKVSHMGANGVICSPRPPS